MHTIENIFFICVNKRNISQIYEAVNKNFEKFSGFYLVYLK